MDAKHAVQLATELQTLIENGSEAEARKFVIDHFAEFPPETQRELAVGLFSDALDREAQNAEEIGELRKIAADAIDEATEQEKK